MEHIYSFFTQFPDWLATLLLSMLPVTELRGSIPFAMGVFGMPAWEAFILAVLGDVVPAILIVLFLKPIADFLSKHFECFRELFDWWFNKVTKNFEKKYTQYGVWALLLFVAIPLPVTGAWSGAIASFLFKIPKKQAIIFIAGGLVLSGIIVTLISMGALAIF